MGRSCGASRTRSLRCMRRATTARPPENVGLVESDPGLDLRPRWQDSDRLVRRRGPVGPVDLGIVEGGPIDPALQIIGNQKLRRAAEETETCARGRRSNPATSASTSPLHRGGSRHRARQRRPPPSASLPSSDRRSRSAWPNSPRTPSPRRHDGGAAPESAAVRIHEADRRSSRNLRDRRLGIPPRGSSL
jgi:hypothetical protein